MKKFALISGVLLLAAGAAYWMLWSPSAQRHQVCSQLESLCGADVLPESECAAELETATEAELDELRRCVEPADSCLETVGCVAGSAVRQLATGAARGLLR